MRCESRNAPALLTAPGGCEDIFDHERVKHLTIPDRAPADREIFLPPGALSASRFPPATGTYDIRAARRIINIIKMQAGCAALVCNYGIFAPQGAKYRNQSKTYKAARGCGEPCLFGV